MSKKSAGNKSVRWAALVEIDGYQIVYRLVECDEPGKDPFQLHQEVRIGGGMVDMCLGYTDEKKARAGLKKAPTMAADFLKMVLDKYAPIFVKVTA